MGHTKTRAKPKRASKKLTMIQEAKFILSPEFGTSRGIYAVEGRDSFSEHTDVNALIAVLREQTTALQSGNSDHMEAILFGQANVLQQMFVKLLERAGEQESIANMESCYRLALKAQSQCRMTLNTLAEINNPPTIYARQANIAHGPQQVNNAADTLADRLQSAVKRVQNELLEEEDGQRLDTRTKGATGATDSELEAVEVRDGTHEPRR